jgi:hypothetical protein
MRLPPNRFLGVQQDRYGAIVDQLNYHMRLEDTGFNPNAESAQASNEFFIKSIGVLRWRGLDVRRPAAAARVSIQRELRDDERGTANLYEGAVHLARIVGEDAQVGDFLRKIQSGFRCIAPTHAEQDQHSRRDFPGYTSLSCDTGLCNTLDDGTQNIPLFRRAPSGARTH